MRRLALTIFVVTALCAVVRAQGLTPITIHTPVFHPPAVFRPPILRPPSALQSSAPISTPVESTGPPKPEPTARDAVCSCSKITPVASDASPDPQRIREEIDVQQLHALLGNRDVRYGNWAAAIDALAHQVDPDGRLGIASGAMPNVADPTPLIDGEYASDLVNRVNVYSRRLYSGTNQNPFGYGGQTGAGDLEWRLLYSIARTDKYGEPAAGLRDALLRFARFLVADIAPVRWNGGRVSEAYLIAEHGSAARSLARAIRQAGPMDPAFEDSRGQRAHNSGPLALDDFDLAQAALETLDYTDDDHPIRATTALVFGGGAESNHRYEFGYYTRSIYTGHIGGVFQALLSAASIATRFGGDASEDSPGGKVACRAFETLKLYAADDETHARGLRLELVDESINAHWHSYFSGVPSLGRRVEDVARAALSSAGPESDAEAQAAIHAYATALRSGNEARAQRVGAAARDYLQGSGAGAATASTSAAAVRRQTENELLGYRRAGYVDDVRLAEQFLRFWPQPASNATAFSSTLQPSRKVACENGGCNLNIEKQDATLPETWEWQPTIKVISTLQPNRADGVDEVARDEPFMIEVTVPLKEDPYGMEVHVEGKDGSSDYSLTREDEDRVAQTVTYRSLQPVTFERGGDGTYGFFRKFMETPLSEWFGHLHGDFRKMQTADGETVKLSVRNTAVPLTVFENSWTKRVGDNDRSLNGLWAYYDGMLRSAAVPDALKAPAGSLHRRLHLIADYRQLMAYQSQPSDHFSFSNITRAEIGDTYLADLQRSDADLNARMLERPDAGSPIESVSYIAPFEQDDVAKAIRLAEEQIRDRAWHGVGNLTIAYFDAYVTGSCFVMQHVSGGLAPCADQLWVLMTGTDTHGNSVSSGTTALTALEVASPALMWSGQFAMEKYADATAAEQRELAALKKTINEERETNARVTLSRRSDYLMTQAAGVMHDENVVVGAGDTKQRLRLSAGPTIPGSVEATGVRGPPMLLQKYDNNCFLAVLEWIRRKRGLPPLSQEQMFARVYAYERAIRQFDPLFTAYHARKGTFWHGQTDVPKILGFEIETVESLQAGGFLHGDRVSAMQMRNAIQNGHHVMTVVETTSQIRREFIKAAQMEGVSAQTISGLRTYHSVVVSDIFKDAAGTWRVTYGDPWNGKFWNVDACAFAAEMQPASTIILR